MSYSPILLVHLALTVCLCALGILFFWRLRQRKKPVLAWSVWVLGLGYTLSKLWPTVAFAYMTPGVVTVAAGSVSVMLLSAYVSAIFYTPWPPIDRDEDDGDDTPFRVPDEV